MNIKFYFHKAMSLPPEVLLKKVHSKIKNKYKDVKLARHDEHCSTYVEANRVPEGALYSYLSSLSTDDLLCQIEQIIELTEHYLNHRFDLLGSGWGQVRHGMKCHGLEDYKYDMGQPVNADPEGRWLEGQINGSNLAESQRIWQMISDRSYVPIDWQLDFKSGWRWSERTWYKNVEYGYKPGVDVKVPWELARMQHLPQLAYAYILVQDMKQGTKAHTAEANSQDPQRYVQEFRNQVLDFIATNPPRWGVNWRCTMDVAIRVSNWLVTYDLFRANGAYFDKDFESVFRRSVYEHGLHIINNLEWSDIWRNNHYLSDIVGLLFVAVYLPRTPKIDAWLALAVQELVSEVWSEFYDDGANAEASTSYHRLSSELVIYATALVLGLPEDKKVALRSYDGNLLKNIGPKLQPAPLDLYPLPVKGKRILSLPTQDIRKSPFPQWYFDRLERMAEFTMHITKPNGLIPQIGDNDSGRFLKLAPVYDRMTVAEAKVKYLNLTNYDDLANDAFYLDENILDHHHLVAAINGLFDREDLSDFVGSDHLEAKIIRGISGGVMLRSYTEKTGSPLAEGRTIGNEEDKNKMGFEISFPNSHKLEIPIKGADIREGLRIFAYPDFGLFIYRSKRLYLAVRCGPVGQNGNGGHGHNDQLGIELNVDGQDWIVDPGTYVYTPLPDQRNKFRSVKSHFVPQTGGEQNGLGVGLFTRGNEASAECKSFSEKGFKGELKEINNNIINYMTILPTSIELICYSSANRNLFNAMYVLNREFEMESNAYGKLSGIR